MHFFRLYSRITGRRRLPGLLEHYQPVARGAIVVETALKEYLAKGNGPAFQALAVEIDTLEGQADKIKRRIRNHLPRDIFLEVDKTLFLNYTRSQDNVLDSAQDAINWLGMRPLRMPEDILSGSLSVARQCCRTVELVKPALQGAMDLVYGVRRNRSAVKEAFHEVREQHHRAAKEGRKLKGMALEAPSDHRDLYQFMAFIEGLVEMSHNAQGASDVLRAMIAR